MSRACLAVDVGGTKIAAALVDEHGAVLARARRPTDAAGGGASVLDAMAACLDSLDLGTYEVAALGVCAAGVIDSVAGVVADATAAMPGWKGQRLADFFGRRYGVPVACANDVHCALAGELWHDQTLAQAGGAVAMLTLGTGLGGALAVDGRIVAGHHFLAGHFGRTLVADGEHLVPLESLVSGSALALLYRRAGGGDADGATVMARAHAAEPAAAATLARWLDHLALALHNLYWTLDPALLLLGGGVIDAREHWWRQLEERIAAYGIGLRIAPAALGNDAGVIGAARLAWSIA